MPFNSNRLNKEYLKVLYNQESSCQDNMSATLNTNKKNDDIISNTFLELAKSQRNEKLLPLKLKALYCKEYTIYKH